mgnify:FL=1
MTAIEWLIEELENNGLSDIYLVSDITDKAKEMEKQQTIDAFEFGYEAGYEKKKKNGEKYYEEQFKKK